MRFPHLHDWNLTSAEARALQQELRGRVRLERDSNKPIRLVAGADVSYEKRGRHFFAAVAVLELPELRIVAQSFADGLVDFPYVPGLLSFRELPVLLQAFEHLELIPDAVLLDGQGIAHPRRLGIAGHLGLWLDLPTVGCAKSRLCGEAVEPGSARGDRSDLMDSGERIGQLLRTKDRIKPMYISPGHLISIDEATLLVLACCTRYRMPEPTRQAHLLSNALRRGVKQERPCPPPD